MAASVTAISSVIQLSERLGEVYADGTTGGYGAFEAEEVYMPAPGEGELDESCIAMGFSQKRASQAQAPARPDIVARQGHQE